MSFELNMGTVPENLRAQAFAHVVFVGDYEISMEDFCWLVKYVLTNADLAENDPRKKLVDDIQNNLTTIKGLNETYLNKNIGAGKFHFTN